ncbi:MAG: hypothetical protein AAGE79_05405 [Acinetobacter pittii]
MSNKIVNEIRELPIHSTPKHLLWVIADIADDNGQTGWYAPTSRLIKETGLSNKTIAECVSYLKDCGILTVTGGAGRQNHYSVTAQNFNPNVKYSPKKQSKPVSEVHQCTSLTSELGSQPPVNLSPEPVNLAQKPVSEVHTIHHIHQYPSVYPSLGDSENAPIRTTDASRYATDTTAATADKNRAQDAQQFSQTQQLNEWLAKNKPIGTEMGNDGYLYAIYPGGKGVRISDERGTPIQAQPKGAGANSTAAAQNEERQRISRVNAVLDEIQRILPDATASYAGRGIDLLARGVGIATSGDIATGKLGTLGGQLVALMPKMSGPQSDKDVAMYKQMAGQLDDPTVPLEVRQAALETIRSLNNKYAEMNAQRPTTVPYRSDVPANTQPQNQAKLNNILFGK